MGKKDGDHGAKTEFDPTEKPITPLGGFVGYGEVREDYLIIKVCTPCPRTGQLCSAAWCLYLFP